MKIAFLFPGQGSQYIGMGKDLYETYEEIKDVYNKVSNITGIDVARLTFESDENVLTKTNNAQIAILTMSLGILALLEKNNIKADVVSGLSLGEYTALIKSNVFSFEDGVRLVQKRGEYMHKLTPNGEWSMAALLGVDEETSLKICEKVSKGFIKPVNFNAPGQIVLSGEKNAILEAIGIAKEYGVKKAVELNTAGPFHTEMLKEAADALGKELDLISINKFENNVLKNINGEFYEKEDNIKSILYNHMISPVRFDKCINKMLEMGIDTFIEIGPGKTLTSFVKRASKDAKLLNINDVSSFEAAVEFLKK